MPMPTVTTGEDVRRQQLQMSIDQDIRQEPFQASLQRDVELSLASNPGFSVNLPMPTAQFATPPLSRQARLDRDLMNYAIDGGIGTSPLLRA